MIPSWLIPVMARIAVANGVFPILLKRITGLHSRTTRFFLQYLFCVALAIVATLTVTSFDLTPLTLMLVVLGAVNALAAYAQWKAVDISLSATAMFTFWDDIIAMGLSYVILHEARSFNPGVALGIALSLGSVVAQVIHTAKRDRVPRLQGIPLRFYAYVGFYSLIWGVATFLMKYYGSAGVTSGSFILPWYAGAFLAATGLLLLRKRPAADVGLRIGGQGVLIVFFLSACVIASLALGYWAYRLAPQNVVQPFFLIGEMIVPALIGFFLFGERKGLDRSTAVFFSLAALGGLLIALNYR